MLRAEDLEDVEHPLRAPSVAEGPVGADER
jgi:hypothetical protein